FSLSTIRFLFSLLDALPISIQHFSSESHYMEGTAINYTLRRPYGIAGCISPWNLPLYLFTWKIAPALAAGNCVIAKPSEITPMRSEEHTSELQSRENLVCRL